MEVFVSKQMSNYSVYSKLEVGRVRARDRARDRVRDDVYVAAVPLRATKGPPQFLFSLAYSFNFWDLNHFMVIISPSFTPPQALVFDFQPKDPEDLQVALAALSGKSVPGVVLKRKLSKVPQNKCWYIGSSEENNGVEIASKFNKSWDTNLRIGHHDCRDYTNGLVEALISEENVLDRLKDGFRPSLFK